MSQIHRVPAELALADAQATEALGAALARALPREPAMAGGGAAVLHLRGDLGAGKTTCVRSLLREFGVAGPVRSPTYTLVEIYETAGPTCIHVDLYRLGSAEQVEELGLRDQAVANHLFLIEWPERGGDAVPAADLDLELAYAPQGRRARLRAPSGLGKAWLENLSGDTRLFPYLTNLT